MNRIVALVPYGRVLRSEPGAKPSPVLVKTGSPFERAAELLGSRFERTDTGFRLDGRVASAPQVIIAANAVAAQRGLPLIAYPGVAEIHTSRGGR